ncbi:MAG: ribonuclease HII [bacterium]|nr:ribonuclease HII [bacterium]
MTRTDFIIGIDEVGRGSLAGPVTVAAVLLPSFRAKRMASTGLKLTSLIRANERMTNRPNRRGIPLRDSKKLSASRREAWYKFLKNSPGIKYAVSHVRPATIDRINISNAANLAAYRTLQKLLAKNQMGDLRPAFWPASPKLKRGERGSPSGRPAIFLDGGLYMRNSIQKTSLPFKSRTITKGDEKIPAIALASIIAKVRRDALMKRLHKKHVHYGFDVHKGYGTKKHFKAIKKYGLSEAHRESFC